MQSEENFAGFVKYTDESQQFNTNNEQFEPYLNIGN